MVLAFKPQVRTDVHCKQREDQDVTTTTYVGIQPEPPVESAGPVANRDLLRVEEFGTELDQNLCNGLVDGKPCPRGCAAKHLIVVMCCCNYTVRPIDL